MNAVVSPPCPSTFRLLTVEERQASMHAALARGWNGADDVWVFGYGSLIWRPEFEHTEQRLGLVRGYHRALCLWSRINRGTPENPGLVFGLDRGGACRGMAFRLRSDDVPTVFPALWEREMGSGAYLPRWLRCETAHGDVSALVFVMNRDSPSYAGQLAHDAVLSAVRDATGKYGRCLEYVASTARALREHGIADHRIERLVHQLAG